MDFFWIILIDFNFSSDQSILGRPLRAYNLAIYGIIQWKWPNYIISLSPKHIKTLPRITIEILPKFEQIFYLET